MRKIITTEDGSHTVISEDGLAYHSTHGAVQESQHVFIKAGLKPALEKFGASEGPLRVFEMGFGTGLNAYLTALEAEKAKRHIHYTTIDTLPLPYDVWSRLQYRQYGNDAQIFDRIHRLPWEKEVTICNYFALHKVEAGLSAFESNTPFQLIYFDAFAPEEQPELLTEAIFRKMYEMTVDGGMLTTYCAKGQVRRNMKAAGFTVERIPGPPCKRQMMRATASKIVIN